MAKKVLIISYYYPPENSISSRRPLAFAKAFQKEGFDVTVLTRHWEIDNFQTYSELDQLTDKEVSFEEENGIKTIRIAHKHISSVKYFLRYGTSFIDLIFLFRKIFNKSLNLEMNVYYNFHSFLKNHLKNNEYDTILVSIFPLNLLRLLSKIKHSTALKVVDVRDYYNNHMLKKSYHPNVAQKLQNYLIESDLKRWFKKVPLIVSVNDSILKKISKYNHSKKIKVLNGYEQNLIEGLTEKPNNKFTITILGALYFQQRLDIMVKGFTTFIWNKSDVKISFIGTKMFPDVGRFIETSLPYPQVEVTNRTPRESALASGLNSQVLFYLGWKGYEGMYSGKIFEYLGLKKNILLCPGDDDVLDALLKTTNAGISVDTAEEMAEVLEVWYKEWKEKGNLHFTGNEDEIVKYTREAQSQILVDEVMHLHPYLN